MTGNCLVLLAALLQIGMTLSEASAKLSAGRMYLMLAFLRQTRDVVLPTG